MNQLKNIDLNNSIIKIQESSDSEGSITEKIKDIKKDFIDTENFEDFLSKNNKKINPNFNKFEGIDGNLNNIILDLLKENIIVNNNHYHLYSIIFTPTYDHYTSALFNPPAENKLLSKDYIYYYDSLNGYIEKIIDNNYNFRKFNPYIGLYVLI